MTFRVFVNRKFFDVGRILSHWKKILIFGAILRYTHYGSRHFRLPAGRRSTNENSGSKAVTGFGSLDFHARHSKRCNLGGSFSLKLAIQIMRK